MKTGLIMICLSLYCLVACKPVQIEKKLEFKGLPEDSEVSGELTCQNQLLNFPIDEKTERLDNSRTITVVLWEFSDCRVEYTAYRHGQPNGDYWATFEIDGNEKQSVYLKRKTATTTVGIDHSGSQK